MKGWEILAHSVRLVFNNLEQAAKISLVPYLISAVAYLFLGLPAARALQSETANALLTADPSVWINQVIYVVIYTIAALWIAVAWHRYVLLEEYPTGWVPRFHSGAVGAYFLRGLLIGLLIFGVVVLIMFLLGSVLIAFAPALALMLGLVAVAASTYLFYRLCAVLPAAAMGKSMRFGEAWEATRGSGSTIAVLVILVVLASVIIQIPSALGGSFSIVGIAYSLVVNWVSMLIGVSVLTTFYGHYVEGRPID